MSEGVRMDRTGWLLISPHHLTLGTTPAGSVVMQIEYDAEAAPWLCPDIALALEFTPQEARSLAEHLLTKVAEVEAT